MTPMSGDVGEGEGEGLVRPAGGMRRGDGGA